MLGKKRERLTFNEKINPKNIYYNNPPDFKKLADLYPEFSKYVYKNKYENYSINWKNKQAVKELCQTLLKHDFKLDYWDIPDGFLIPSMTSRCNYINWIHDLLEESHCLEISKNINGIDIGTGANCIYPLLGHKIYGWNFKCSEVNSSAIAVAQEIINKNTLQNYIQVVLQEDENKIFDNIIEKKSDNFFHFSMCNPPYFSIEEEIKKDNPNTVCEYNDKEVYCKGGELKFISRIIDESKEFRKNVIWFTTLVGKKVNFDIIHKDLENIEDIKQVKSTTFYQGKLARWGLAWCFFNVEEMKKECENNSTDIIEIPANNQNKININYNSSIRLTHRKDKHKKNVKSYCEL